MGEGNRRPVRCDTRRVSFVLELKVPQLDWAQVERLVALTAGPGLARVRSGPRRRWFRSTPPSLWLEDERDDVPLLSDDADFDQTAFAFDARGTEMLARTVELLGGALPAGCTLRSSWIGDALEQEVTVAAAELAAIVRRSAMDRGTAYRLRA